VEGRSALLLGKAKDNNASCAIGPFLPLFDAQFTLDDVRQTDGASSIARISRDPADLVVQTVNPHHPYPDGAVLFLSMMFAPVEDRDAPGKGFTHKAGDIVTISASKLGRLVNRMMPTDRCEPGNSASVRRCEISPGANCCDSRFQPCRRTCGKPTALTERSLVILTAIVRPGLPRSSA
jgi:fumarylacetoacetate (FAA) hydrolase family protein